MEVALFINNHDGFNITAVQTGKPTIYTMHGYAVTVHTFHGKHYKVMILFTAEKHVHLLFIDMHSTI